MQTDTYHYAMYDRGLADAADLQARSSTMTGTQLYAEEEKIPDFAAAKAVMNMKDRPAGQENGFICRNSAGLVVRLVQPYDSDIYPQEPGDKTLAAQWRFVYSKDPRKARPFLDEPEILSLNYYNVGECCTENGHVYRSTIAANVYRPSEYAQGWDDLGTIEEVMAQDWDVDDSGEPTEPEQPEEEGGESSDDDDPYKDVQDWFEPDSQHYYNKGDRMRYTDGHVYESLIDVNTYSPDAYPQGWKLLA